MKKIIAGFFLFFLAVCVFGQSNDAEIEKLKKAVIPYSGETLEDAYNVFAKNSFISYEISSVQQDFSDGYKNIDIKINNEFGEANFFYSINLSRMEAFLTMVILNKGIFFMDIFGLPTDVLAFTEYRDWVYNTLNDR
jgi:hypothetical protein